MQCHGGYASTDMQLWRDRDVRRSEPEPACRLTPECPPISLPPFPRATAQKRRVRKVQWTQRVQLHCKPCLGAARARAGGVSATQLQRPFFSRSLILARRHHTTTILQAYMSFFPTVASSRWLNFATQKFSTITCETQLMRTRVKSTVHPTISALRFEQGSGGQEKIHLHLMPVIPQSRTAFDSARRLRVANSDD